MKVETINGIVTAKAETIQDVKTLLSLGTTKVTEHTRVRKYKKQMPKTCTVCGQQFKGMVGLGIHMARAHKQHMEEGVPKLA